MPEFSSFETLRAACNELGQGSDRAAQAASARQDTLTKPQGSLGRLEELAIWLARWQRRDIPRLDRVEVQVFAGSHGVTARGVSAFPAEVTAQMVANFEAGGAAVNQLANQAGASLNVVPLQVDQPTRDFTIEPAMLESEFIEAIAAGYDAVSENADLVCLGEMGIGNTTSAAAICALLFGGPGAEWVGRGTGVDDEGLTRKAAVVDQALDLYGRMSNEPLGALAAVGGRELAAIFGAVLAARHKSIPVLLDGFVCTAAAAPLTLVAESGLAHTICAHRSAEQAHINLLEYLKMQPLLDMNMRLGEASGACLAINILRSALACHNGMASFAEAGVSGKD
ncbi:MAG: nicotinate-nucleotide--dimethylbenzimidazole phosphoribosyltransferase [Rhizobiaceae bacterium]